MADLDDEIRILKESIRLLGDGVQTTLLNRGWAPKTLDVADDQPIEWFWPPTAPIGYGGLPELSDLAIQKRPQMYGRRHTPMDEAHPHHPNRSRLAPGVRRSHSATVRCGGGVHRRR